MTESPAYNPPEHSLPPEQTHRTRVAVIGCGYWGVNYVRVFSELREADLVAICEPRADRLAEIGARFPHAWLVQSLDELLTSDHIDAVVVATGATTHFEVTRRCLEAGKHVLVEKPLATSAHESAMLTRLAAELGRVLMVGHTFIFNPAVARLRKYVEDSALGRVYYLYSRRTNLGPVRHDVNAIWDLAPHDVSIFNHLLGEVPNWVSATGIRLLRNEREDVGFLTLSYPSGVVGNIHVSWADPNKVRELVIVGSSGRVVFDDVSATEPIRLFERSLWAEVTDAESTGDFPLHIRDGDIISPRIVASEPLKNQCRHFLECATTGARPQTAGEDGLAVVAVMEAIERSVAARGAPTEVEFQPAQLPIPSQIRVEARGGR